MPDESSQQCHAPPPLDGGERPTAQVQPEPPKTIKLIPTTPLSPIRIMPKNGPSFFNAALKLPPGPHGGHGLNDALFNTKVPDGWTEYIHPDGKPYFVHNEWHVVTEKNVRRDNDRLQVEMVYHAIMDVMAQKLEVGENVGGEFEIFIMISDAYYYYLISHETQEVFWLNEVEFGNKVFGPADDGTEVCYDILLREQFYGHIQNFPCHREVPGDGVQFLHGYLAYIVVDDLTTHYKTTPWDPKHAKLLLDMLDSTLSKKPEGSNNGFRTFFIARLLSTVFHVRAIYRHGTERALNNRPALPPQKIPSAYFILGVLCFFTHLNYEARLRQMFEAEVQSRSEWRTLMTSLIRGWTDSNLLATVTFSANMAFLALELSQVATTCSIISALFASGSIVVGVHHVWKHRDKTEIGVNEVATYHLNIASTPGDIRRLGILLSLPIIFLLWSLLALTCAVANYAFTPGKALAAYIVVGCVLGIVCMLGIATNRVFWNVFTVTT